MPTASLHFANALVDFYMHFKNLLPSLVVACLSSCHTYVPMPIDLDEHLSDFRNRIATAPQANGVNRVHARELAKMFHPDARLARRRASVTTAQRDHAGSWTDPQLQSNLQRILESVPYQWVPNAQVSFTIPINGRLQKQRELADRKNDEALFDAWSIEQQVANDVDRAWVQWSSTKQRIQILELTCDNLEQLSELADKLVETGSLNRPSARVFSLERRQKAASRAMAIANERAERLEILRRIGLHPDANIDFVEDLSVFPFLENRSARQAALPTSPRLLAQQLEHHSAEANLHLQIRMQWPDLQILPGWQEEDGQPRAGIGLNLTLPLFTGNDPAIAKAIARRDLTAAALRAALEQLLQELAIAEIRYEASIDQTDRFAELIDDCNQQIEDGRSLAQAGQLDPLLMLDALLRLHGVKIKAIEANLAAALATITINTLLTDPNSQAPAMTTGEPR